MTRRYAATSEKVELLIEYLEQEGVIAEEWAEALRESGDEPGKAREVKESHKNGRGPPDWANAGGNDENPGNSGDSE